MKKLTPCGYFINNFLFMQCDSLILIAFLLYKRPYG